MLLKDIVRYQTVELPVDWLEITSPDVFSNNISEYFGTVYEALPVVIMQPDLPSWQILIIFEYLRKQSPEIVLQIPGHNFILLYSVLPKDRYTRPEQIQVYPELFTPISEVPTQKILQVEYDLAAIPPAQGDKIIDTILAIKQALRFTDSITLKNAPDAVTALIAYTLWLAVATNITYQEKDQSFEIFNYDQN